MRGWTFLAYGTVAADLYDLGAYPGAVPSVAGGSRVRGELYRAPPSPETLARLDHHEGEEFERAVVDVTLDSGETKRAWIYWYRSQPTRRRIRSGDYLERETPTRRGSRAG